MLIPRKNFELSWLHHRSLELISIAKEMMHKELAHLAHMPLPGIKWQKCAFPKGGVGGFKHTHTHTYTHSICLVPSVLYTLEIIVDPLPRFFKIKRTNTTGKDIIHLEILWYE